MYYKLIGLLVISQYIMGPRLSWFDFGLNLQIPNRYHFVSIRCVFLPLQRYGCLCESCEFRNSQQTQTQWRQRFHQSVESAVRPFERLPDGVRRTALDAALVEPARQILRKYRAAEERLDPVRAGRIGPFRVFAGQEPGAHVTDLQYLRRRNRARAGLHGVPIHDLRHSWASRALALGESLSMIGRLLSHSQVETTARYAHLALDCC